MSEIDMNFNEAYEANKTKRVKLVEQGHFWEVGQMAKREKLKKWDLGHIHGKWEIEEHKILVSRKDIFRAWDYNVHVGPDILCEKLGLKY